MNSNNLIFSSSIDKEIEDNAFDILLDYLKDAEYDEVFVHRVALSTKELIFFAKINGDESIIRVPLIID